MHFTRLGRALVRANDRTIVAAACTAVRFSIGGETDSTRGGEIRVCSENFNDKANRRREIGAN